MVYEFNFDTLTERVVQEGDLVIYSGTLGDLICTMLSVNFEEIARQISDILISSLVVGGSFPETEIRSKLADALNLNDFEDFSDIAYVVTLCKNIHKMLSKKARIKDEHRSLCFNQIFDRFRLLIALQAYLDESEESPDLCMAKNFERFSAWCLEREVPKQECAISLNESNLLNSITSGCNIRDLIKESMDALWDFNDALVVMAISGLSNLALEAIYYIFTHGLRFKRCKNCGRFFIPFSRSDEIYCNNPSPQNHNKTCKQYGSDKLWYDRLKQDETAKLSRNIYMAKQMLAKRNPDIVAYKEMFEYFKTERKIWEQRIKNGEKTREEYLSWLNTMKSQKTLK